MLYEVVYTKKYERRLKRFLKQHPEVYTQYDKTIEMLKVNPHHPALRLHKLKARFAKLAEALNANTEKIVDELIAVQGKEMDIGGYYRPDEKLAIKAMRPSATFNNILAAL